jgi:hypothetical protein
MPEEQAFCVLVKIMFDYGLRDLFKLGFDALHLRFYQLQRLVEVEKLFFVYMCSSSLSGRLLGYPEPVGGNCVGR